MTCCCCCCCCQRPLLKLSCEAETLFLITCLLVLCCQFCSTADAIDVNISQQSLQTLLLYWYGGKLMRLTEATGWCAWNNLETEKQILYLQGLVELAQFAGQLLMTDLQGECNLLVVQHIEGCNLHLGPSVLTHAAKCAQWDLVDMCAKTLAPAHPYLHNIGALESLDDSLRDLLRVTHIQFTLSDSHSG
jgi:hypothetical protein